MAKFVIELGDWYTEITKHFALAEKETEPIMKMALWEGANVTANAVNRAADRFGVPWHCGISKHYKKDDGYEVSVGYRDAYYFTNRYGNEVAIDLVVNVINTGTSRVKGNHFFDNATKSVRGLADQRMMSKFYQEMNKLLGD